ncbi:MAG: hypothetical protein JSW66_15875 [Phycisphaerales bacterium]|nr:MAG: hypothetical protein JSW66_15875 [Phycisphaerales bacterium]
MNTIHSVKSHVTLLLLIAFVTTAAASAYPPDNAAILYYKAFMLLQESENVPTEVMADFMDGKVESNEQIREYLKHNQPAIEILQEASRIEKCQWALDHSKGFDLPMPELSKARKAAFLLVTDAQKLTEDGHIKEAFSRCLTAHRMANHISSDDLLISDLVGIAIHAKLDKTIKNILSRTSNSSEILTWLKDETFAVSQKQPSLKSVLKTESEIAVREMRKEKLDDVLHLEPDDEILKKLPAGLLEKIKQGDEAFFNASKTYYTNFITTVQDILDMPYSEAYKQSEELTQKSIKDASTNPGAIFAVIFAPSLTKLISMEVRHKTSVNALNCALGIYAHKAGTGALPDEIPADSPKDLFSNRDFEYEKTKDGFVLRCRGRDLFKDEIHEYEFKVPK